MAGNLNYTFVNALTGSSPQTQASHTYPAHSIILVHIELGATGAPTASLSVGTPTGAPTFNLAGRFNNTSVGGGGVEIWVSDPVQTGGWTSTLTATSSAAGAVALTIGTILATSGTFHPSGANCFGAVAGADISTSSTTMSVSLTTTFANSWVWWQGQNFTTNASSTALTGNTLLAQGNDTGSHESVIAAFGASTTTSATLAVGAKTCGATFTAACKSHIVAVEILDPLFYPLTQTASLAVSTSITATGAADGSASLNVGASITADGSVSGGAFTGGATLSPSASITAAGSTGVSQGASLSPSAAITAAGSTGTSQGASLSPSVAITATGSVVWTDGASLSPSVAITAGGVIGLGRGATLSPVATITAAGTAGDGASLAVAATITAAGSAGKSQGASLSPVATITAAGGGAGQTSLAVGVGITAAGVVAAGPSSLLSVGVSITAAGTVATLSGASVSPIATILATGSVGFTDGASLSVGVGITAAGTLHGISAGLWSVWDAYDEVETSITPDAWFNGRSLMPITYDGIWDGVEIE